MTGLRVLMRLLVTLAAVATAGAEPGRVPGSISLDDEFREGVARAAAASPTLRRQLDAIELAGAVVQVNASLARLPGFNRAATTITRHADGQITARLTVPPGRDFIELLAHELEHIVEQIEGVDLASLVRAGAAWTLGDGVFESARAREAGRAAAAEVAARAAAD